MEIEYDSKALRKICQQERVMTKKLGKPCAKKLKARLADLHAATVMTDVKRGRPHPLQGERADHLALELKGGWRLVIRASEEPPPRDDDAAIAWNNVMAVTVTAVEDYHD